MPTCVIRYKYKLGVDILSLCKSCVLAHLLVSMATVLELDCHQGVHDCSSDRDISKQLFWSFLSICSQSQFLGQSNQSHSLTLHVDWRGRRGVRFSVHLFKLLPQYISVISSKTQILSLRELHLDLSLAFQQLKCLYFECSAFLVLH